MFKKIKPWISAFRLRTLPLSVSGIIIGACLAEHNGSFSPFVFIIAILLTISLQILSNLANDYGDGVKGTDNENRVGPERAIQSGAISEDEMMLGIKNNILIVVGLAVALIYASFGVSHLLLSLLFLLLAGLSIYAAISYTVGESAYGYRGLGDVFVFIFFGLVSVGGSYLLFAKHLDHHIFLPAVTLGLLSVGVLNLNNMRDIDSDRASNKMTLAVKLGKKRAKQYHLFLIGSAIAISVIFGVLYFSSFYNLLFFIAFIPLCIHMIKISKAKVPNDFDSQLKVLALTTFLFSVLLGVGYIL
ncbi:1,4-dihydroxy-2-naphthoate octaprenyltransferase [Psychroserpens jangbogonensis]|uniref:1,4-dihydroxy-2-naphthoate octaprenyltransferase n=1 Tax=Psychroserpens jangbogonensis TaxID=1484460 RepID=UPI00053D7B50|nr:1,4-dihydroxy-2-naphthoate octaprenyltransferase [Psychroserpens jangbogonensis]